MQDSAYSLPAAPVAHSAQNSSLSICFLVLYAAIAGKWFTVVVQSTHDL
jgi:hypothetical protein